MSPIDPYPQRELMIGIWPVHSLDGSSSGWKSRPDTSLPMAANTKPLLPFKRSPRSIPPGWILRPLTSFSIHLRPRNGISSSVIKSV